jgi:hypothetical protein
MKAIWRILLRVLTLCTGVAFAQATTPTPAFEFTHRRNSDWLNCPGKLYRPAYGELPAAPPS